MKEKIQNAQKRLEKFVYDLWKYPLGEIRQVDKAIQVTLIEIKKIFSEEFGDKLI